MSSEKLSFIGLWVGGVERDGWIEDAVSEAESSRFTDGSDGRRVVTRANQKTRMTLEFC